MASSSALLLILLNFFCFAQSVYETYDATIIEEFDNMSLKRISQSNAFFALPNDSTCFLRTICQNGNHKSIRSDGRLLLSDNLCGYSTSFQTKSLINAFFFSNLEYISTMETICIPKFHEPLLFLSRWTFLTCRPNDGHSIFFLTI